MLWRGEEWAQNWPLILTFTTSEWKPGCWDVDLALWLCCSCVAWTMPRWAPMHVDQHASPRIRQNTNRTPAATAIGLAWMGGWHRRRAFPRVRSESNGGVFRHWTREPLMFFQGLVYLRNYDGNYYSITYIIKIWYGHYVCSYMYIYIYYYTLYIEHIV